MSVSVVSVFTDYLSLVFGNVRLVSVSLCESPLRTNYIVEFAVSSNGICPLPELVNYDDVYVRLHIHKVRDFQFSDLIISTPFSATGSTVSRSWVAYFKELSCSSMQGAASM